MFAALKEVVAYRGLLGNLVGLDLKVRYRGSFFGALWTLLNPVLLMLVLWFVFSRFGRIQEKSYAMFLLSGLMIWLFFQQAVSQSLGAVVKNKALIQKIYVPKMVFPLSVVTSNLVNMVFFLVAYHLIVVFTSVGLQVTAPLIIPVFVMVYLLAVGWALIMSTANVFFRDFSHLTQVLLRALFYLTPVLYRPSLLGDKVAAILKINPVSAQQKKFVFYA
jgi:ABC-type polysaccharide/polyol phosphate export permease